MARAKTQGNGLLEEAMAILINNQSSFLARIAEMARINSERFARIESLLLEHSRVLAEHGRILAEQGRILTEHTRILADHTRILQALPEMIRQKIGFQMPEPQA